MADTPQEQNELASRIAKIRRSGEERAAERLAEKLGYPYADLSKTPVSLDAVRLIHENDARDGKLAAIEAHDRKLAVVAVDPTLPATKKALDDLQKEKYDVKVFIVSLSSLNSAFSFYKFVKPPAETITGKVAISKNRLEELAAQLATIDAIHAAIAALDFNKASPNDLSRSCSRAPWRSTRRISTPKLKKKSEDPVPRGRSPARRMRSPSRVLRQFCFSSETAVPDED